MEWHRAPYRITTEASGIDPEFVHRFLTRSYWAEGIPLDTVRRSMENSMVFGVFDGDQPVGFARVITDQATFAYLADVFIIESHRGRRLSRWLVDVILAHPDLQGLRRFLLATRDAHGLYAKAGFTPLTSPDPWMQIHRPAVYRENERIRSR